jgi:hypothetical protein
MSSNSELFWSSLYTFAGGFLLAIGALCYKSKCESVNILWGACVINRAVEVELQEDLAVINRANEQYHEPENEV